MGGAKTLAVEATRIQKLEEVEEETRKNESLAGRFNDNKLSLKNGKAKLTKEDMENLAVVRDVKKMEQQCQILRVEKGLLYKPQLRSSERVLLNVGGGQTLPIE